MTRRFLQVALLVEGCAQEREEHVIWRVVFRVEFEDGPLKILNGVRIAVDIANFLQLVGDGVSLLGQAAVAVPVFEELPFQLFSGGRESHNVALSEA